MPSIVTMFEVVNMARPKKQTIEYFPHFVTSGKTMFILESNFGNDGYAFWFKLLELLGNTNGMYYDCNNLPDWEFLLAKTHVNEQTACNILNTLADLEAIDKELWYEGKIIWSQNLVNNVCDAFKRRTSEIPQKPLLHTETPSQEDKCIQKPSNSDVSTCKNGETITKETKVKESKVNNNKEDNINSVVDYYCQHANILSVNFKPKDFQTVEELLSVDKIPIDVIKQGIDMAFKNYKPDYPGAKINSFNFCKPFILKLWKNMNIKKEAVQDGNTREREPTTDDPLYTRKKF